MDEDAKQFLEAIFELEQEVEALKGKNMALGEERHKYVADEELKAINERLEREARDVLEQLEEYEKEKEEELLRVGEESSHLQRRLTEQAQASESIRRRVDELEKEREGLLELMTEEGQELRARLEKALRDKEVLSLDLGRAQARADMAAQAVENATRDGSKGEQAVSDSAISRELAEASNKLRTVMGEREALKDEVTNKESQNVLLRSQLEVAERKLRLSDYETAMLKNELEVLRRQLGQLSRAGGGGAGDAAAKAVANGGT